MQSTHIPVHDPMKAFFYDIFAYHNFMNQKLLEQLVEHHTALPERTIPLFCHCINAHQIWNARILGEKEFGVHHIHPLSACGDIDNQNFIATIEILNNHELGEIIRYKNSKGKAFSNSIRDILFHVANHFAHHRGQIISDIRQSGIEPIVTDYIFYVRKS